VRRSLVVLALLSSAFQQTQPPTFRTGTNLVQIDAIVTDHDGETVTDLTADDFELQDDGKPMTIRSLRLLGRSSELAGPFAPIRNEDDELREASRDEVRVFAILLDDYHVARQHELRVIPALRSFVEHLPATDLVGVYGLFDSIRDAHLNRDRETALKAISAFYGRRGDYTPKFPVEEEHLKNPRQIEQIRLDISRRALEALAIHLGGLKEGRKTLLFVSEGFPMETIDMLDISRAANRTNVAIYPIDPLGMPVAATRGSFAPLGMTAAKDVLKQFALDTGAEAIVNTNDFARGLAQVARDSSAYYLLAYESPHPDDAKFHNVSVKVKRPRLTVRARSGYFAFKQAEQTTTASVSAPQPSAEINAALARLAESLRPDAGEPAESRRFHMLDSEQPAAPPPVIAPPELSIAQGRLPGAVVARREFPRVGSLVARAATHGGPEVAGRLLAQDGRALTDLPVVTNADSCEIRLALPTLGQGDYVIELTARLGGQTTRQYIAFRVRR
jgi:VWFA-related protein